MSETPTPSVTPAQAAKRLQLKVVLLWSLVASLGSCALLAVILLLVGTFNNLTERVLFTLGALGFHSGMALAFVQLLERRSWPRLNAIGVVACGVNFVFVMVCTWWPGLTDDDMGRGALQTLVMVATYLLAIPGSDLLERHRLRAVAWPSISVCLAALVMVLICIWAPTRDSIAFGKATGIACILAFTGAQTCVLVHAPTVGAQAIARVGVVTLLAAWALAGLATAMIIGEWDDDLLFRMLGALGVIDATGSVALLVLLKLRQIRKDRQLETVPGQVELRCPRCTKLQAVATGAAECGNCGLRFRIEIEEPRCLTCGYLLWQLPERRCPECGRPF
jgi:hypothetical protein